MTTDQIKKLEELQEILWSLNGDGTGSIPRARLIVHDLLATPHPFAEHWQEESV